MKKISTILLFFSLISCSQNKPVIEVIYNINEFSSDDNRLNITLDITNKTNKKKHNKSVAVFFSERALGWLSKYLNERKDMEYFGRNV